MKSDGWDSLIRKRELIFFHRWNGQELCGEIHPRGTPDVFISTIYATGPEIYPVRVREIYHLLP